MTSKAIILCPTSNEPRTLVPFDPKSRTSITTLQKTPTFAISISLISSQPNPPTHRKGNPIYMAQNATHRRLLATPEAKPLNPVPSSMDPTLQKHRKSSSTHQNNKNPDPKVPTATPFYTLSSRLKTSVKPNKNTTCIETLLQAKDMTKSADFDASRRLRQPTQPNQQKHKANEPKVGKDIKPTTTKERTAKEKAKVKTLSHEEEEEKKEMYFLGKGGSDNKEVNNPNFVVEGHELKRLSFGGRRRSFCGVQLELGDFLANNGAKVVAVDMPPFMQIHAIDCARKTHDSLEKFSSKALALTLKKEFDGVYGPAWHCIVGISFGSFVTHSVGGFLYFSIDQKLYILLFKTTVQRAD